MVSPSFPSSYPLFARFGPQSNQIGKSCNVDFVSQSLLNLSSLNWIFRGPQSYRFHPPPPNDRGEISETAVIVEKVECLPPPLSPTSPPDFLKGWRKSYAMTSFPLENPRFPPNLVFRDTQG